MTSWGYLYKPSLPELYALTLREMDQRGEIVECPAWKTRCRELVGMALACEGGSHRKDISRFGIHTPQSLLAYVDEMLDGTLDWAVREGKEPYTYHDRLSNQWREALDILREDPSSRRATMTVRIPSDITMDDQPCLTTVQLLLRKGKLDMITYFRSNDLWKATYMNAYALMELQMRWANELGVTPGGYLHNVGSLHVYENDWVPAHYAGLVMRTRYAKREIAIPAKEFWEAL